MPILVNSVSSSAIPSYMEVPPDHKQYQEQLAKGCERVLQDLLAEYPSCFADKLEAGMTIDHKPIRIKVKTDTIPVCHTVARDYPPGKADICMALEEDMLKAGIIKRFDKPTDWCSMAFFLPKGPDQVRMVLDFRHLSRWSTRVGYPFASSESVFRSIPATAKVFLSLDLLQ